MAAPMHNMAGAGQFMPQQQNRFGMGGTQGMDMQQFVYNTIASSTIGIPPGGWQNGVAIGERVRNAQELISNMLLANPNPAVSRQQIAHMLLQFESESFTKVPDKAAYDHRIRSKIQELYQKRHNQAGQLQDTMNLQRQQAMMNAQQQQNAALMRAQMAGRVGVPGQQGYQHLQNPMQLSQFPQQAPKMGLSLSNGMTPQTNPGQPGFPTPGAPQRHANQLSDVDRQRVHQEAMRLMQEATPQAKQMIRDHMMRSLTPQAIQQIQAEGKNPMLIAFQNRAFRNLFPHLAGQGQQQQQQQPGMPSNPQGMQMQPGQQRPTNMMGNMGQPGSQMPFGSNMESIINEQKQGMLAERQGQMVVPASSAGHTPASQTPLGGVQNQHMFSQGPGQTPRPQMPNGFDMQQQQQALLKQQLAQSQAHMHTRQATANLQGQSGGLGGPMPVSQNSGMNSLNAPAGPPPGAIGQIPGAQGAPSNPTLGGLDARFNQPGPQGSMPGAINQQDPLLKTMLASLTPEHRNRLSVLSKPQLEDFFQRWKMSQGLMPGRPGQPQHGMPMSPADPTNAAGMSMQQANGGMSVNMQAMIRQQQQQNQTRMRQGGAMPSPNAVMDNMDVPAQVFTAIQGIPPNVKKWGQLKIWIQSTNSIPEQMKMKLRNLQMQQFQQIMQVKGMMGAGRGPGAETQQPGVPRPSLPPAALQIEVTPQEIQRIRATNPRARELPDEHVRAIVQNYKFNAMMKSGNQALGPQQAQMHPAGAPPSSQPAGPSMQAGVPSGMPQGQPNPAADINQNVAPGNKANQPPQGKAMPPKPSPAAAAKNLKRPGADDLEAPTQSAAGVQRSPNQAAQHPLGNGLPNGPPQPTEAQLASLSPEQRQAFERKRHLQKQLQEFGLFYKNLGQEEGRGFDPSKFAEVSVPEHMKDGYKAQLLQIAQGFVKVSHPAAMMKWFYAVRDEARLRMFLKWRLRVIAHFEDGDKLQAMKDRFTLSVQDIAQCKGLLASVFQEMRQLPKTVDQQPPPPPQQQQGQPAPKPAPPPRSNEASSAKPAQVHNKLPQRPNSRGVQPPAAPTSSQPPFSFGAHSPDGKPVWTAPAQVTQDSLHLPRKKIKTGPQTSSPAGNSQTASPQTTKAASPDLKKQEPKAAPKPPTFPCTVPDCEMGGPTFVSEALRKKHQEEFHVQPFQNPLQFLEQSTADLVDFATQAKPDTAISASHEAATKPLGSVPGGPATQGAKLDDNKITDPPKPSDNGTLRQAAMDAPQQQFVDDFGLLNGTIDPASLFAPAFSFDPMYGGVISDPNIYRSTTPIEDTPESSKDSGTSEPNSDIPEATSLDIEMNFTELDGGMLMDLNFGGDTDPNFETITDDMLLDMDKVKPFQPLDMSLYEWNC